jgi:hypothetical protein
MTISVIKHLADLGPHIAEIARAILGEPNERLSTRTQLRFGTNGSVAVEIAGQQRGQWYDHEAAVGGGPWELLTVKGRMTNGEAREWLRDELGIELDEEQNGKRRIVATYDYRDERGDLLQQVVRFEPKDFRQRRPDGNGGWIWKKAARQVPYRLPELIDAPADCLMFVVEGEKDADRLASLGLVATCNAGGAAKRRNDGKPGRSKWRPELNPFFQGRDVVILPDNDDAGRDHARSAASNLAPVAARVRILELPGLGPKDDVSEWLNTNGSPEELQRLAADALTFSPEDSAGAVPDQGNTRDVEAEIARLAKLSAVAYERERDHAAGQLGIRVSILDRLVKAERGNGGSVRGQGQPVELFEPEPWAEPVDGAALLNELTTGVRQYVVLDVYQARAVALWVVFTYAFALAVFAPKLLIKSPQKRSGKTRLLQVLYYLVPRAKYTSQITGAALFRLITDYTPVMLIDEGDTFLRDNVELRGILNSGYDKPSAKITRNVPNGDGWEARDFSTWCPQAIAGIGSYLDNTVVDRSFVIELKRKLKSEKVERLRERDAGPLRELARKAARWVADHRHTIEMADPELPPVLDDRAADAWALPVAIADVAGGDWPTLARQTAVALSGETADESTGVLLLADLRELFSREPSGVLFTKQILAALHKDETRPWSEWRNGKAITDRQLAAQLKAFRVIPKTVRRGERTDKGYKLAWFEDTFARYLPPRSVTASQTSDSAGFEPFLSATPAPDVTDEKREKASVSAECDGVTDPEPLSRRDDDSEWPTSDPEEAVWMK